MAVDLKADARGRSAADWLEQLSKRAGWLARTGVGGRDADRRGDGRAGPLPGPLQAVFGRGSRERPLAAAGAAAGAGLLLGAALVLRRKPAVALDNPEEIIARALCREDPDTPTHLGPLWAGYRKDARRVLAALREAGWLIQRL